MIKLHQATKYFHRHTINEVLALNDVSLDVEEGDFITVIGSNGAGKSSLLNCLAGTFFTDSGRLSVDGEDVTRWPEYRRAQYTARVFQDPLKGTCASMSIAQNLALAQKRGQFRGLGIGVKKKDQARFQEKLSTLGLGLENRLADQAGLLSGGQRQALTMLMATLVRPKILLLDEHTAALDPKTAHKVLELTQEMVSSQKLTTLMITHQMHHALKLGNRLIMMHQGQIVLDVRDEEKQSLTVDDLLARFYEIQGNELPSDRMLLG